MELLLGVSILANLILTIFGLYVYRNSNEAIINVDSSLAIIDGLQTKLAWLEVTKEADDATAREREANLNTLLHRRAEDYNKSKEVREKLFESRFTAWKTTEEKRIRADANLRSRAVIRGQATEHLAPFMCTDYAAKDYRFLGNPIDFLICDGLSAIKDNAGAEIKWVVLMDVKTGNAQLSKSERRIRDAVVAGRVKFVTYNPDTETTREWIHELPDSQESEPTT
jgi:predicted Holliday junction resolvase-like endonuclease